MIWFALLGAITYLTVSALMAPVAYNQFRGRVKNAYSFYAENQSAKRYSLLAAAFWPLGAFFLLAFLGITKVDRRAELTAKDRAELDRFRAAAMRELEQL